jgi:hypothetical protein
VESPGRTNIAAMPARTAVAALTGAVVILLATVSMAAQTAARDSVYFDFQVDKQASTIPGSPGLAYPRQLQAKGVAGEVMAQFVVDTAGYADMTTFKVLRATDPVFVQAVRDGLPRMRFKNPPS